MAAPRRSATPIYHLRLTTVSITREPHVMNSSGALSCFFVIFFAAAMCVTSSCEIPL